MRLTVPDGRSRSRAGAVLAALTLSWGCGGGDTPTEPGSDPDPTPTNQAPIAAAGTDLAVSVGFVVSVDGSGSTDPDGDALTYAWTLTAPAGSAASLDDVSSATPSFLPDVEGDYVLSLTVNDGTVDSGADQATVTATDNTVTEPITAAAGGSIVSSDGEMTMTVAAGALSADTDISVTTVAEVQVPDAVRDLPGNVSAYDVQPDGTTFSTPVEIAFDIEDAVTHASGSAAMSGAFLLSESDGTIESMSDVVLAQDDVDPTKAMIKGGLSHFSHALFVAMSMEFRLGAPDEVNRDEPFDVTFTIDITGAGLDNIRTATVEDASAAPVGPFEQSEPFTSTMVISGDEAAITNSYVCSEEAEARIRVNFQFEATDEAFGEGVGSFVTVQLGKDVTCTLPPPPLETMIIPNLFRAQRLVPVPGSDTDVTTGGLVRRINLETTAVVELSEASSDPPEWVSALSDGSFLVHSALGSVDWFDPNGDPQLNPVSEFDQARHVMPVSVNTVALASAFGDLGFITYTPGGGAGGFQDAFRNLASQNNPQQSPATNLQAIWVSADAQTFIGAVTEGDGDSAFNRTQAAILDADVQGGQISVTVLPGIIDFILDPVARHQFDLECGELAGGGASELLCVFTSGFDGPSSSDPNMDLQNDGYVAVFTVDAFDRTSELLYWDIGNARVGAGVFPVDGSTTGVAVANQFTEALDVWHVQGGEVVGAFPVAFDQPCANPTDFILIADGARGALTCQAQSPTDHSVLVVRNLNMQQPPGS